MSAAARPPEGALASLAEGAAVTAALPARRFAQNGRLHCGRGPRG